MKVYIDKKFMTWERYTLDIPEEEFEEWRKRQEKDNFQNIAEDQEPGIDVLTWDDMLPEENNNEPTIELRIHNQYSMPIWDNGINNENRSD